MFIDQRGLVFELVVEVLGVGERPLFLSAGVRPHTHAYNEHTHAYIRAYIDTHPCTPYTNNAPYMYMITHVYAQNHPYTHS